MSGVSFSPILTLGNSYSCLGDQAAEWAEVAARAAKHCREDCAALEAALRADDEARLETHAGVCAARGETTAAIRAAMADERAKNVGRRREELRQRAARYGMTLRRALFRERRRLLRRLRHLQRDPLCTCVVAGDAERKVEIARALLRAGEKLAQARRADRAVMAATKKAMAERSVARRR